MKSYIVSSSKRALLLSGALAIFTACDDSDLGDIYRDNSSSECVSDVNWTDVANKSTGAHIKYFYENASGRDTFCGSIYWEKSNTPGAGEPANTDGSGGWSQGHALDIVIDTHIRHASDPEHQTHLYESIMKPSLPAFDDWNEHYGYNGKDFWDSLYDDMGWMAPSCLRVYELTGDQDYCSALVKMQNHIKEVKSDCKGVGEIARRTGAPTSHISRSNGPGCLLVMKLYQLIVKEAKDDWEKQAVYYLNFAKKVYNWMMVYLCDISAGQVHDNLSIKDDGTPGDPSEVALSYNRETFVVVALEPYNTTDEDEYLRNAVAFGSYQVNRKMDSNYPVFSGEGNSGGNLLLRGIFVHYFLDMVKQSTNSLYPEKTRSKFIAALHSCPDVLWTSAHPKGYYVWEYDWARALTFGSHDNRGDRLTISLNAEVPGTTIIEIRACYEDWVQGKAMEKTDWIGPGFGKKIEE